MQRPLSVRIRKAIKRRVRAALQYCLRKLDDPSSSRRDDGSAARSAGVQARPGAAKQNPKEKPGGKARSSPRSPRPGRPLPYTLQADEFVDIGCVKVFRAERFPSAGPAPWLDRDDARQTLESKRRQQLVSDAEAALCHKWIDDGYVILPRAIPDDVVDATWAAYEASVRNGRIKLEPEAAGPDDSFPGRFLNPHFSVPELDRLLMQPVLMRTAELLLGREPVPFQTITSHKGSQQGSHSDSIHMTTYPVGYLTACWIAMEDIHPDSGPLSYFPGSHRAPYLFSHDVGITVDDVRARGYVPYHERYEPAIRKMLVERQHAEQFFIAKKGDVLFWHANLVHGGSPRRDLQHSRKAVVCHYYAQGCICYHDLNGSPAHVHGPIEKLPVCGANGV